MGYKYEVWAWVKIKRDQKLCLTAELPYTWLCCCKTDSIVKMIIAAIRAKRMAGCIKIEWR